MHTSLYVSQCTDKDMVPGTIGLHFSVIACTKTKTGYEPDATTASTSTTTAASTSTSTTGATTETAGGETGKRDIL